MRIFSILLLIFCVSCSSSNCRKRTERKTFDQLTKDIPQFKKERATTTGLGQGSTEWVEVYKADGSLQCGVASGLSAKEMSKDLLKRGIKIIKSGKKSDGLMHIQVCGSPTGMINVYTIQKSNVKRAEKLNYRLIPRR